MLNHFVSFIVKIRLDFSVVPFYDQINKQPVIRGEEPAASEEDAVSFSVCSP